MSEARLAQSPTYRLRRGLLACYGDDADFGAALETLYRDHCESLPAALARREPDRLRDAYAAESGEVLAEPSTRPAFSNMQIGAIQGFTWPDLLPKELTRPERTAAKWARAYLAAIRALAERYGLHRIDSRNDQRTFSGGESLVHGWCGARAAYGPDVDARWIGVVLMPYVNWMPSKRVTIVVEYDPLLEDPTDAEQRGYRQVRAAVSRIADDFDKAGWKRPRVSRVEGRDLDWLHLKMSGCTFPEIAARYHPESQGTKLERDMATGMVQRAVHRMAKAKRANVDTTDW